MVRKALLPLAVDAYCGAWVWRLSAASYVPRNYRGVVKFRNALGPFLRVHLLSAIIWGGLSLTHFGLIDALAESIFGVQVLESREIAQIARGSNRVARFFETVETFHSFW